MNVDKKRVPFILLLLPCTISCPSENPVMYLISLQVFFCVFWLYIHAHMHARTHTLHTGKHVPIYSKIIEFCNVWLCGQYSVACRSQFTVASENELCTFLPDSGYSDVTLWCEVIHGRSVYIMIVSKHYKSELFFSYGASF